MLFLSFFLHADTKRRRVTVRRIKAQQVRLLGIHPFVHSCKTQDKERDVSTVQPQVTVLSRGPKEVNAQHDRLPISIYAFGQNATCMTLRGAIPLTVPCRGPGPEWHVQGSAFGRLLTDRFRRLVPKPDKGRFLRCILPMI